MSGWTEAFPTTKKRTQTVSDVFLQEIIPWFRIPTSLQLDNSPEFTSQISQTLSKALNIPWHFYIPYHPQSSERTNHSLKNVLVKMSQELHLDWVKLLPLTLLRLRALPQRPLFILPFEPMYGQLVLTPGFSPKTSPFPDHLLTSLLSHLHSLLWDFYRLLITSIMCQFMPTSD